MRTIYWRLLSNSIKRFSSYAVLVLTLCVGLVASTGSAYAKDFSRLKVVISDNVNKDCGQPDGYDTLRGCYVQKVNPGDTSPTYQIFIRSGLPTQLLYITSSQGI